MSGVYKVVFGSPRVEKEIVKFLKKLPHDMQQRLYHGMRSLGIDPRPRQILHLSAAINMHGYTAQYRLRVGEYRILYDIDDKAKTVVLLAVRRRSEKTYRQ